MQYPTVTAWPSATPAARFNASSEISNVRKSSPSSARPFTSCSNTSSSHNNWRAISTQLTSIRFDLDQEKRQSRHPAGGDWPDVRRARSPLKQSQSRLHPNRRSCCLAPHGVDVRQTTSSALIGITVGQVFKSPGRSSEPHSFRAAWAKRWRWRVFTGVFVTFCGYSHCCLSPEQINGIKLPVMCNWGCDRRHTRFCDLPQ